MMLINHNVNFKKFWNSITIKVKVYVLGKPLQHLSKSDVLTLIQTGDVKDSQLK